MKSFEEATILMFEICFFLDADSDQPFVKILW